MKKNNPDKEFLTVTDDGECACAECRYMNMNTLKTFRDCLKYEKPDIVMDSLLIEKAKRPIVKMLEMSKELGIIK